MNTYENVKETCSKLLHEHAKAHISEREEQWRALINHEFSGFTKDEEHATDYVAYIDAKLPRVKNALHNEIRSAQAKLNSTIEPLAAKLIEVSRNETRSRFDSGAKGVSLKNELKQKKAALKRIEGKLEKTDAEIERLEKELNQLESKRHKTQ